MQQQFTIRRAEAGDAAALLEIYRPFITDTVLTFEYDVPESDTYLPADSYFDEFYLVEKGDLGGQRKTVTIKIGNKVVYTESFDENIL